MSDDKEIGPEEAQGYLEAFAKDCARMQITNISRTWNTCLLVDFSATKDSKQPEWSLVLEMAYWRLSKNGNLLATTDTEPVGIDNILHAFAGLKVVNVTIEDDFGLQIDLDHDHSIHAKTKIHNSLFDDDNERLTAWYLRKANGYVLSLALDGRGNRLLFLENLNNHINSIY